MRAIIFILIVVVLVVIAGVASGFLRISQTRPAQAPQIAASGKGVTAKGGQAPGFDVETGSVKIGARQTTVKVPALEVKKPGDKQPVTNNAM